MLHLHIQNQSGTNQSYSINQCPSIHTIYQYRLLHNIHFNTYQYMLYMPIHNMYIPLHTNTYQYIQYIQNVPNTYQYIPYLLIHIHNFTDVSSVQHQFLMDVFGVYGHSKCIALQKPGQGAYTRSCFWDKVESSATPSGSYLKVQGLYSPTRGILLYFSSAQWPKIWFKCSNCRLVAWQSALHHRHKQCPGEPSTVCTLIHLHLLQARRPMWWGQWCS